MGLLIKGAAMPRVADLMTAAAFVAFCHEHRRKLSFSLAGKANVIHVQMNGCCNRMLHEAADYLRSRNIPIEAETSSLNGG
jgi:hypothetical protein